MNNPLVTICIPVYLSELYIEKCLKSVFNQSYSNINLIINYDPCDDNTLKLTTQLLSESPYKYKLIEHNEKPGLGAARNRMLDAFNGDYLYFLDSDDYIESNCIEYLVDNAIKYSAEVVIGSYREVNEENENTKEIVFVNKMIFNSDELKKFCFFDKGFYPPYSWNKLFSSSYLENNNIRFRQLSYGEDAFAVFLETQQINKIILLPEITLNYLIRENSLTTSEATVSKIEDIILFRNFVYSYLKDENSQQMVSYKLECYKTCYILIARDGFLSSKILKVDKSKLLKKGLELTHKIPKTSLKNSHFSFSKILYLTTQNSPMVLNLFIINLYGYYKRINNFFKL
tara:strand:+ start:3900 stop:4928 length:1029 start_codon:yes stop_codon:yes gene_type:complete